MSERIRLRSLDSESDHRKSKIQNRKWVGFFAIVLALTFGGVRAEAQQPGKVYRLGYLSASAVNEAFRQGLRDLGYIEGKNLAIEFRQAEVNERYPELAAELVRLRVNLIFAVGVAATRAAKEATSTIPIVRGNASDDPVRHGLVASLARPGGNVTGLVDIMSDLAGKRLELLKETFPKLSRVAHLSARGTPAGVGHLKETQAAARELGVQIQPVEVSVPQDLESAFRAAREEGAEALIVVGVSFFIPHRQQIVDLQLKNRLPAMHTNLQWAPAGGLMSYTTDGDARYRRAAEYVDRILKGANPANLPVERPNKFVFEINLKTAKQIGVTIPQSILFQVDRVIK